MEPLSSVVVHYVVVLGCTMPLAYLSRKKIEPWWERVSARLLRLLD